MITLDYRDKRPLYEQIVEKLRRLIVSGALAPGEKLPSVRSLALDLSINPNTVQRAYAQLEADGYLYTVTGRGNYVGEMASWKQGHLAAEEAALKGAIGAARSGGLSLEDVLRCAREVFLEDRNAGVSGERGGYDADMKNDENVSSAEKEKGGSRHD